MELMIQDKKMNLIQNNQTHNEEQIKTFQFSDQLVFRIFSRCYLKDLNLLADQLALNYSIDQKKSLNFSDNINQLRNSEECVNFTELFQEFFEWINNKIELIKNDLQEKTLDCNQYEYSKIQKIIKKNERYSRVLSENAELNLVNKYYSSEIQSLNYFLPQVVKQYELENSVSIKICKVEKPEQLNLKFFDFFLINISHEWLFVDSFGVNLYKFNQEFKSKIKSLKETLIMNDSLIIENMEFQDAEENQNIDKIFLINKIGIQKQKSLILFIQTAKNEYSCIYNLKSLFERIRNQDQNNHTGFLQIAISLHSCCSEVYLHTLCSQLLELKQGQNQLKLPFDFWIIISNDNENRIVQIMDKLMNVDQKQKNEANYIGYHSAINNLIIKKFNNQNKYILSMAEKQGLLNVPFIMCDKQLTFQIQTNNTQFENQSLFNSNLQNNNGLFHNNKQNNNNGFCNNFNQNPNNSIFNNQNNNGNFQNYQIQSNYQNNNNLSTNNNQFTFNTNQAFQNGIQIFQNNNNQMNINQLFQNNNQVFQNNLNNINNIFNNMNYYMINNNVNHQINNNNTFENHYNSQNNQYPQCLQNNCNHLNGCLLVNSNGSNFIKQFTCDLVNMQMCLKDSKMFFAIVEYCGAYYFYDQNGMQQDFNEKLISQLIKTYLNLGIKNFNFQYDMLHKRLYSTICELNMNNGKINIVGGRGFQQQQNQYKSNQLQIYAIKERPPLSIMIDDENNIVQQEQDSDDKKPKLIVRGKKESIDIIKNLITDIEQNKYINYEIQSFVEIPNHITKFFNQLELQLKVCIHIGLNYITIKGFRKTVNHLIPIIYKQLLSISPATKDKEIPLQKAFEIPQSWEQQEGNLKLVEINLASSEGQNCCQLFKKTMMANQIVQITRIQNISLMKNYLFEKQKLIDKGNAEEQLLFHGTRSVDPKIIYSNSEEGFDFRLSNDGLYGKGSYFHQLASYSDSYKHINSQGYSQMFIASVLIGNSYISGPSRYTAPPFIVGQDGVRYDSVRSNYGEGQNMYIVYHNSKSYPLYLITYN